MQTMQEKIFAEFGTLSVVYNLPSERFVDSKSNDSELVMPESYERPDVATAEGDEPDAMTDKVCNRIGGSFCLIYRLCDRLSA